MVICILIETCQLTISITTAFGWVQNISSDLTSAEPQADKTAAEGETVTLTLFFTKNNPANSIRFDFNIATSGTATGMYSQWQI